MAGGPSNTESKNQESHQPKKTIGILTDTNCALVFRSLKENVTLNDHVKENKQHPYSLATLIIYH